MSRCPEKKWVGFSSALHEIVLLIACESYISFKGIVNANPQSEETERVSIAFVNSNFLYLLIKAPFLFRQYKKNIASPQLDVHALYVHDHDELLKLRVENKKLKKDYRVNNNYHHTIKRFVVISTPASYSNWLYFSTGHWRGSWRLWMVPWQKLHASWRKPIR